MSITLNRIRAENSPFFFQKEKELFCVQNHFIAKINYLPENFKPYECISDQKKFLITANPGAFHYINDLFGYINAAKKIDPLALFIVAFTELDKKTVSKHFFVFLEDFLNKENLNYCILFEENIVINNVYYHDSSLESLAPNSINLIHDSFLDYIDDKTKMPNKKVYVSRKMIDQIKNSKTYNFYDVKHEDTTFTCRVDDEALLETFFANNGFEIFYPESFNDFKKQINYFYDVKTIVSLTSGGLVSSMFMQSGTNVIELVTPMVGVHKYGAEHYISESHHHYYSIIAYQRDQFYFGVNNSNRNAKELIDKIKNNKSLMKLIEG